MTAKRWEIIDEEFISYTGGTAQLISNGECEIHLWENPKDAQLFCDKLNAINEENEQLKSENKELQMRYDAQRELYCQLDSDYNNLYDENEQLKQRNDRQAKRLGELYELMAKKDWKSLTEIIDDFKRCEEQLQRESGV